MTPSSYRFFYTLSEDETGNFKIDCNLVIRSSNINNGDKLFSLFATNSYKIQLFIKRLNYFAFLGTRLFFYQSCKVLIKFCRSKTLLPLKIPLTYNFSLTVRSCDYVA